MPDVPVPVVASTGLAELLAGPARRGTVVGAGPAAAYVAVSGPSRPSRPAVVAIEAPGAVGLPCGLGLSPRAPAWLPGAVPVGTPVGVASGHVTLHGAVLVVARWRRARPRPAAVTATHLRARAEAAWARVPAPTDPLAGRVADRADALARAAAVPDVEAAVVAVEALCGLGEGSTPSGDDVVAGAVAAGMLLAAATTDAGGPPPDWWARLGARAATLAPGRTTTLSAALLGHAARGEVAEPVAGVLHALAGSGDVTVAMARLLAVGHRSGADLARGVLLAADLVGSRPSARAREVAHA